MAQEIPPSDFSDIRWRGNWIWTQAPEMPRDRFAARRGTLEPSNDSNGLRYIC